MMLQLILSVTSIYLSAGLIFSIVFLLKGIARVDEGAAGASLGFRVIILPGLIILWPMLLKKWIIKNRT